MKNPYKPVKLYSADINDLVEEDISKGGAGSGIRGHHTEPKSYPSVADMKRHLRMKDDAKNKRMDKMKGHIKYYDQAHKDAKLNGRPDHAEHYHHMKREARSHMYGMLSDSTKDQMIQENQKKIDSQKKQNPGT